ncbi:hypothetical protein [Christiangramia salexigens]|uniref:Secreted protein n=1 Tax=Christiangramia salexigens TaxID=1913577 RepID=A0A1L3J6C7_9FLAO|nr:hypothetical protein [Christiangramia salexigens]APG60681.1 hypothetical protein LPB144_09825 [Christiangramia salexigens]
MKTLKKLSLLAIAVLSVLVYSCKDEEKSDKPEATSETATTEEMKDNMSKSTDTKYNPAHGVEGHRCDLPVGAPLTEAGTTTTPVMNQSPVRLQNATPRINPAHGEPGHDCSVPVGAELN